MDNILNEYRIIDGDSPVMVGRETATLMILMIQWAAQWSLLTKSSASAQDRLLRLSKITGHGAFGEICLLYPTW